MSRYIDYKRHGQSVAVRKDLKGNHNKLCMCWDCEKFLPQDPDKNCYVNQAMRRQSTAFGITTPIVECVNCRERRSKQ